MDHRAVHLEIPDAALESARRTLDGVRAKLAVHLYELGRLPIGKDYDLAGLSPSQYRQVLGSHLIDPHFDVEELDRDLETLLDITGLPSAVRPGALETRQ